MTDTPLLSVRNLSIEFPTSAGILRAVDDVTGSVSAGETLAILGKADRASRSASAVMDLSMCRPPESLAENLVQGTGFAQAAPARPQGVERQGNLDDLPGSLAALNPSSGRLADRRDIACSWR